MRPGRASVSALLFSSGLCALIYQTAWFRELRLIFGSSTPASAAVLAIFMGGLGLGSALLGKRADTSRNPLALYAKLEAGIALSAAMSPLLVMAGRWLYIAAGGSATLGSSGATIARLLISGLILAVPTILMGGTLPAAARAVEVHQDSARRRVALIYAANTFGAVTGAALSTFLLLELLGNRRTLWLAAALNLIVALVAWLLSRGLRFEETAASTESGAGIVAEASADRSRPRTLILAAAAVTGFAFILMEIVWYRALSPLLGGSTYTFGLILAVALGGIGTGGFFYSLHGIRRRPTLSLFALTCAAEALFLAIPYALGDRIAILAVLLRRLGAVGFFGFVSGWSLIVALVALPAAMVAGYQFPLLVALLGKGKVGVGRDAGHAYAWNTAGAIAGSLAGGFGILPLLTLLGTWKLVVVLMTGLSLISLFFAARANRRIAPLALPLLVSAGAVACLFALGPTEVWRHSPIGAGREDAPDDQGSFTRWIREQRSSIEWEFDGIESTVGLQSRDSFSFLVNGKSDGSARYDAGTQVMSGLIGALLHPEPRKAFVIGLGTGSTAGWLGRVPGMQRVDVAELEPGIVRVAEACVPVNADPLGNPRVRILFGDARELLLTSRESYDVIFSEPSNPYRAGVASLFTKDFYEAASMRLNERGLFLQWLQGYEIEPGTVRNVYATLLSVFPHVQTWQSLDADLILVGSASPISIDADILAERIASEPYSSAMSFAWRTESVEGFLARHVGTSEFARMLGNERGAVVNTDDRNRIEFEAARAVGQSHSVRPHELRSAARGMEMERPPVRGSVDWDGVQREAFSIYTDREVPGLPIDLDMDLRHRADAHDHWVGGRLSAALASWEAQPGGPQNSLESAMVAEALADDERPNAELWIDLHEMQNPIEAAAIRARLRWRQRRLAEAAAELEKAFVGYRTSAWPIPQIMRRALIIAEFTAAEEPELAPRLWAAVSEPFAVKMMEAQRRESAVAIARRMPGGECNQTVIRALEGFEPWFPWDESMLRLRLLCYGEASNALSGAAFRDLAEYMEEQPEPLLLK